MVDIISAVLKELKLVVKTNTAESALNGKFLVLKMLVRRLVIIVRNFLIQFLGTDNNG